MRVAIKFLQWPVNGWIILYISWSERKLKCPVLRASLLVAWNLGNVPGRICGSDLIHSVFCGKVRTIIIRHIITFNETIEI